MISGVVMTGFSVFRPLLSRAAVNPSENSDSTVFFNLSLLLTAKTHLSRLVAQRALHCLAQDDIYFLRKLQRLAADISLASVSSADMLYGHPIMAGPAGETVKKIISAWYLGYTGIPVSLRAVDSTQFVTYTEALAYAPTLDATVIPTYSRGSTNYWVQPPISLKSD